VRAKREIFYFRGEKKRREMERRASNSGLNSGNEKRLGSAIVRRRPTRKGENKFENVGGEHDSTTTLVCIFERKRSQL